MDTNLESRDYRGCPGAEATPLDRFRYIFGQSHRSQVQFAKLIGIDASAMSKIMTGKMPLTDVLFNKMVVNLGLSKAWISRGEGVPYPREEEVRTISTPEGVVKISTASKGAPVFDIDVTAGTMPLSTLFTEENLRGYIDIPQINPANAIVRVSGDSMSPKIPNGAFIAIRPIQDKSIIVWGMTYVIQLEDYRLVKVIKPCRTDPDKVVLHSENPDYDDLEINRSAILNLFHVEAVIGCQLLA